MYYCYFDDITCPETLAKRDAARSFMEKLFEDVERNMFERQKRRNEIKLTTKSQEEKVVALVCLLKRDDWRSLQEKLMDKLREQETKYLRVRRSRLNLSLFEVVKVIGRGAYAKVRASSRQNKQRKRTRGYERN